MVTAKYLRLRGRRFGSRQHVFDGCCRITTYITRSRGLIYVMIKAPIDMFDLELNVQSLMVGHTEMFTCAKLVTLGTFALKSVVQTNLKTSRK